MNIYPVIYIKNGNCENPKEGKFSNITEPLEVAKQWESMGASYLHVLDGDGLKRGILKNKEKIMQIINSTHIPVVVGGGIRNTTDIKELLDAGAAKVVINASKDEEFLKEAIGKFGSKVIIEIDLKNKKIAKEGSEELLDVPVMKLAQKIENYGASEMIVKDLDRVGTLNGSDIVGITDILCRVFVGIIAAGGVSDITDVKRLKRLGVNGVLIGKALYTGAIDLKEIINS